MLVLLLRKGCFFRIYLPYSSIFFAMIATQFSASLEIQEKLITGEPTVNGTPREA